MGMRLTNYRFGEKVCLDHHKPNEVDAFPCTGNGGDVWDFEITAESRGRLRLFNSRFGEKDCLDHHGQDGTVAAYPCNNHGGDEWFYDSYYNSADSIMALPSSSGPASYGREVEFQWTGQPNTCMDVAGGRGDNFNKIQVWACAHAENQRFFFDPMSEYSGTGQIRWARNPNKCLDVKDGSTANFADVILYDCHDSSHPDYDHQLFNVDYFTLGGTPSSTYIRWGEKCVDLKDGIVGSPSQSDSKVVTYDCHGPSDKDWVHQQWNVWFN